MPSERPSKNECSGVRERPILFSGPMVRAILAGQKTQTRRVVKVDEEWQFVGLDGAGRTWLMNRLDPDANGNVFGDEWSYAPCPHGRPGDLLWVRETWQPIHTSACPWSQMPHVVGPDAVAVYRQAFEADGRCMPSGHWRPSIFMPRWASRITLRVTEVRVERLQEITQADARAEGVVDTSGAWGELTDTDRAGPRGAFEALWNDINGARGLGWDANPWVWVVSFERVEGLRHVA